MLIMNAPKVRKTKNPQIIGMKIAVAARQIASAA